MGKRQTRIFPHQLPEKSAVLVGKEANVTLSNQTTFHGIILEITDQAMKLRDMRLKKRTFLLNEITEVVLDQVTDW